jgi:hypothetical protein
LKKIVKKHMSKGASVGAISMVGPCLTISMLLCLGLCIFFFKIFFFSFCVFLGLFLYLKCFLRKKHNQVTKLFGPQNCYKLVAYLFMNYYRSTTNLFQTFKFHRPKNPRRKYKHPKKISFHTRIWKHLSRSWNMKKNKL